MKLPAIFAVVGIAALSFALVSDWPAINTKKELYAEHDLRGQKAPDLFVQSWLNTKGVDTKGKVVLIDFWATWCPPCRKAIPELNEFAKKFEGKLAVIGISDEESDTVAKFMKGTTMNYNVGIDKSRKMSTAIGIKGIPHVIVISPDRVVRWQGFPLDDDDRLTEKVIQQIIDASGIK